MPHIPDTQAVPRLLGRSRLALSFTQNELAMMLGVARRTVGRWEGGDSTPSIDELRKLARAVHPKDAQLAVEIAAEGGTTLEALGLVVPASKAPPTPPAAPTPPPRPFPPVDLMIDSVVHVAAQALAAHDAHGEPATIVRAVLSAAFSRARGLGLTIEEVDNALSPRPKATEKGTGERGKAQGRDVRKASA
jgi:transcriptional regulator with XRE-family HTH domain